MKKKKHHVRSTSLHSCCRLQYNDDTRNKRGAGFVSLSSLDRLTAHPNQFHFHPKKKEKERKRKRTKFNTEKLPSGRVFQDCDVVESRSRPVPASECDCGGPRSPRMKNNARSPARWLRPRPERPPAPSVSTLSLGKLSPAERK